MLWTTKIWKALNTFACSLRRDLQTVRPLRMGSITETFTTSVQQLKDSLPQSQHKEPLKLKGLLDEYESFDVTPTIGREYPTINLKQLLEAPNSDELIRDLAITSKFSWQPN